MLNSALGEFKEAGRMDHDGRIGEQATEQIREVEAQLSELRRDIRREIKKG